MKSLLPAELENAAHPRRAVWQIVAACGVLFLAVWMLFGRTLGQGFCDFDDRLYIYEQPHVVGGLTWSGFAWAFTKGPDGDWCPLAMLSHMLDCQLYGLRPAGHHLTNVLLHAASSVMLFLVLWRMTAGFWPSALVAALFGLHPLRVESVAWIAERRDVLSGFFFMLTLAAYVEYVRHGRSLGRYLVVCAMLALGLLAKAMLITVPALLLLLDFWPLGRLVQAEPRGAPPPAWPRQSFWRLVSEKLPLFVLALAAAAARQGSHLSPVLGPLVSLTERLGNAAVSCVAYVGQLFVPVGLSVFYAFPEAGRPAWQVAAAVVLLGAITTAAIISRRSLPYFFVGWFWYLGMLVPVLELIPVGGHARADRYTYLPQIGLDIALVWGAMRLGATWPARRWVFGVGSALTLAALMVCTWRQTGFWQDSKTLWEHALACDPKNVPAHYFFGQILQEKDDPAAAVQYRLVLEADPAGRNLYNLVRTQTHNHLADLAYRSGDVADAIAQLEQALELRPSYALAHVKLGILLTDKRDYDQALIHFQGAIELEPDNAVVYNNRAMTLARQGKTEEAIAGFNQALRIDPDLFLAHLNLGNLLAETGDFDEAIVHLRRAIATEPGVATPFHQAAYRRIAELLRQQGKYSEAASYTEQGMAANRRRAETESLRGSQLAEQGKIAEAIARFQSAIAAAPNYAPAHCNLADALASQGRKLEAIEHYRRALEIDPAEARAKSGLKQLSDLETEPASGRR